MRELAENEERAFYEGKAGEDWLDALSPLGTDANKPYLEHAPWIIAIFGQRKGGIDGDESQQNYYVPESVGIAMGFLITALHQAGLCMLTHTPKPMSFLHDLCGFCTGWIVVLLFQSWIVLRLLVVFIFILYCV